jgi:hypothetical protein
VRAWHEKYHDRGLVVVGVHTPEFWFEQDPDNVSWASKEMRVDYPIALDPDYAVWNDFGNRYWPAVYLADAQGRIRYHHFGEGDYDECERAIQMLLRESGVEEVADEVASVHPQGFEVQADWANLQSPETYLGSDQAHSFASGVPPESLRLNQWTLAGDWAVEPGACVSNAAGAGIAFRFHARDVNLVLRVRNEGASVPFQVRVDGEAPGRDGGLDVDDSGGGTVTHPRLYQLIRRQDAIVDGTCEIEFGAGGLEAYVFTFG